ncbi:nucleotidyltransferase family protein [Pseudomarimonas salicorniae]|uniref:Nucleotidyltransferase family protein n=1 Tax=Pseudomarimonas salicorniae TaxID=2933270 RepID=A0ABT0GCT7_9GAMM|nr:nucleotidyltransferase family protein [Lysobacter sp. CAU 1642]MCK7592353.1 nucleotidyltransferase family protein [Lysobacter sp. CAU 1642]
MQTEPDHAVVVLAAGQSRRLGQPKQLLRRDGETLIRRALRLALATRPGLLRVILPPGRADWVAGSGAEVLSASGSLGDSLRVGLADLDGRAGRALLLPCDLPRLRADSLQQLLRAARRAPSGIAVSTHQDRPGIPVVIPAPFAAWRQRLEGSGGLGGTLAALPATQLGWVEDEGLCSDLDTPADLHIARTSGWIDPADAPDADGSRSLS